MRPKEGDVLEAVRDLGISCDAGLPPTASPKAEEQAVELMALAKSRQWRVLPVGFAHQLPHLRADAGGFDLLLSTQQLQDVVLYEPGEATITVQSGVPWQNVQKLADENRQCLSPAFAPAIPRTVGGVIAGGFSGLDRSLRGALRHQVLGMRILMADGSVASTGGRLVKNVAGFDLHRLHTGGRGQLGVILEASLRLHNRPGETVSLEQGYESVEAGVGAARRLHSARLPGSGLLLCFETNGACQLSCSLQGSSGLVEDAERAACLAMDFEQRLHGAQALEIKAQQEARFDLMPSEAWLSITCQPTTIEEVQSALWSWLEGQGLQAAGMLQPDVAQWYLRLEEPNPETLLQDGLLQSLQTELRGLGAILNPLGCLHTTAWDSNGYLPEPLCHATQALRQQFDPEDRFQGHAE